MRRVETKLLYMTRPFRGHLVLPRVHGRSTSYGRAIEQARASKTAPKMTTQKVSTSIASRPKSNSSFPYL